MTDSATVLQEILRLSMATHAEVGELRGQIGMMIKQNGVQDDRVTALDGRLRAVETVAAPAIEYDKRLRAVETRQARYAGIGALGGALMGWFASKIPIHFG